jgi:hypothetical protein
VGGKDGFDVLRVGGEVACLAKQMDAAGSCDAEVRRQTLKSMVAEEDVVLPLEKVQGKRPFVGDVGDNRFAVVLFRNGGFKLVEGEDNSVSFGAQVCTSRVGSGTHPPTITSSLIKV